MQLVAVVGVVVKSASNFGNVFHLALIAVSEGNRVDNDKREFVLYLSSSRHGGSARTLTERKWRAL